MTVSQKPKRRRSSKPPSADPIPSARPDWRTLKPVPSRRYPNGRDRRLVEELLGPGSALDRLVGFEGAPLTFVLGALADAGIRLASVHGTEHRGPGAFFFVLGTMMSCDPEFYERPRAFEHCLSVMRHAYIDDDAEDTVVRDATPVAPEAPSTIAPATSARIAAAAAD